MMYHRKRAFIPELDEHSFIPCTFKVHILRAWVS